MKEDGRLAVISQYNQAMWDRIDRWPVAARRWAQLYDVDDATADDAIARARKSRDRARKDVSFALDQAALIAQNTDEIGDLGLLTEEKLWDLKATLAWKRERSLADGRRYMQQTHGMTELASMSAEREFRPAPSTGRCTGVGKPWVREGNRWVCPCGCGLEKQPPPTSSGAPVSR